MKHYLTAQEIAASLRVHVSWVYDHLKRRRPSFLASAWVALSASIQMTCRLGWMTSKI